MGYSRSRVTLNRRLKEFPSFFERLAAGHSAQLVGPPDSAATNSYKVREALHVASLHPAHYPQLAAAANRLTVEILDDHTIQARVKQGSTESAVATQQTTPTQISEAAGPDGAPQIVAGLKTATDLISYFIRRGPTNDSVHFPDAQLSDEELTKVYRWCRTLKPRRVIIKPRGTNAITIANRPARGHPISTAIWRPPTVTPEQEETEETT